MLTEERHQFILQQLKLETIVTVNHLVSTLNVSESTIRRDLSQLEEAGHLIRVHGGAKRPYVLDREPTLKEKAIINLDSKLAIARYSASLVREGETIFVDAGTTTLAMIQFMEERPALVVTNGIEQAALLTDKGYDTLILGGKLKAGTKAIVGSTAFQQLEHYRFQKAFIGMNGVDVEYGLTTPDIEEGAIKSLVIQQSNQAFVLVDNSKFGKVSFCKVANIDDVQIITNKLETLYQNQYQNFKTIKEV